jgi:hypothetical protein
MANGGTYEDGPTVTTISARYRVSFTYLEPVYARARGIDAIPYRGVFYVNAQCPEQAIVLATALFHDAQRTSSVGWTREIQTATVDVVPESDRLERSHHGSSITPIHSARRHPRRRASDREE